MFYNVCIFLHIFFCLQAMRQWWELKTNHYDTILFFKVCVCIGI